MAARLRSLPPIPSGMLLVSGLLLLPGLCGAVELSGRLFLTYQKSTGTELPTEFFSQNLETTLKDRLFEKNDLRLSFYLDNARNLAQDLTTRRYYGRFELDGQYYNFYAFYSPKQKITPLEIEESRELTENQYTLTVRAPSLPQLRILYAKRKQFSEGIFMGYNRNFRADIQYSYKFLQFELNRWYEKRSNSTESRTVVTGGRMRIVRRFYRVLNLNAGYDYLLTQSFKPSGEETDVSNHTISTLLSGRYKRIVSSSLSLVSRFLDSENFVSSESRNNTISWTTTLLPEYWVRMDISRSYLQNRQDTTESIADYLTTQLVFTGDIVSGTRGRTQLARRFVIEDTNGAIPANIFFFSVNSRIYPDLTLRADLNISQRDVDGETSNRYQTYSLFELNARPRRGLYLTATTQFYKSSDRLSFLRNDRIIYSLTATYSPSPGFNLGLNGQRNEVTTGNIQTTNSLSLSSNMSFRNKMSLNLSYGINSIDVPEQIGNGEERSGSSRNTFNAQSQVWLTRTGSLSMNYSRQELEERRTRSFFTVSFRQNY